MPLGGIHLYDSDSVRIRAEDISVIIYCIERKDLLFLPRVAFVHFLVAMVTYSTYYFGRYDFVSLRDLQLFSFRVVTFVHLRGCHGNLEGIVNAHGDPGYTHLFK